MRNTTKQDLVAVTAVESGHPQAECRAVVDAFLGTIAEMLDAGADTEIRCFGTFYVKTRKPRPARNPRTGGVHMLPIRRVALFRFSPDVKNGITVFHSTTEEEREEHKQLMGLGL